MSDVLEAIRSEGYGEVPSQIAESDMAALFSQFEDIIPVVLEEDPSLQQDFSFTLDDTELAGYFFENQRPGHIKPVEAGRGLTFDDKVTFHYGPLTNDILRERRGNYIPGEVQDFLVNCDEIFRTGLKSLRAGTDAFGMSEVVLGNPDPRAQALMFRLLSYRPTIKDRPDNFAALHWDRSAFSALLAEDKPGLVGTPSRNGYPLPVSVQYLDQAARRALQSDITHRPGIAKIILGASFNRLVEVEPLLESMSDLEPLLHGAVQRHDLADHERRHAAIIFAHPNLDYIRRTGYTVAQREETRFANTRKHMLGQAA